MLANSDALRRARTSASAADTALSATVGIGNIAGVAIAIRLGGPGAIFWMWVTAFFGMALKYVECTLALRFRTVHPDGSVSGGCVEGAVVTEARGVFESGQRTVITFGYSDDDSFAVGLTCGGTLHLFLEELDPATWQVGSMDLYEALAAERQWLQANWLLRR